MVMPGIVKFFMIAIVATILSFLATYLLRLIPGVKTFPNIAYRV